MATYLEMNDYQRDAFRKIMLVKMKEMQEGIQFGLYTVKEAEAHFLFDSIHRWECRVPGLLRVLAKDGSCLCVLYPSPRPVPGDPMFMAAEPVTRSRGHLMMNLKICLPYLRDWQVNHGTDMDAPEEMPAGSTIAYLSEDEHDYGVMAYQTTWSREE